MSKLLAQRYEMRLNYIGHDKPVVKAFYRRIYVMYGAVPAVLARA